MKNSCELSRAATDALLRAIDDADLAEYAEMLLPHARPGVQLVAVGPATDKLGGSRIGGAVDLPHDMAWPLNASGTPFNCWMQLNLADLPAFAENPLPRDGLLHVFVGNTECASQIEHRVIYTAAGAPLRRVPASEATVNDETLEELVPHDLTCRLVMDLPHWASNDHSDLQDQLAELTGDPDFLLEIFQRDDGVVGRLLGHVQSIGHDSCEDAYVVREVDPKKLYDWTAREKLNTEEGAKGWRNFIHINSSRSLELCIWDAGYLNVLIHKDALASRDYANTYCCIETS